MPNSFNMENDVVYVSEKYETAIHKCCCGCGNEVVTPIGEGGWTLTYEFGLLSLNPSIGNQKLPCKSHYWIKNNTVVWCL